MILAIVINLLILTLFLLFFVSFLFIIDNYESLIRL